MLTEMFLLIWWYTVHKFLCILSSEGSAADSHTVSFLSSAEMALQSGSLHNTRAVNQPSVN